MTTFAGNTLDTLDDLYAVLPERNYEPLWTMKGALTIEPDTAMVPCLWSYAEARELVLAAGDLISAEDAERRVLAFKNPGTATHEIARATDTLWAAIQLVLPGEVAPPHRHSAAALRYIIEGSGAYTVVDGQRMEMQEGDVLLTPNWSWHEHGHAGQGPMFWLDGLDLPLTNTLHQIFTEREDSPAAAQAPPSPLALRSGQLAPRWHDAPRSPTLAWALADAEEALASLRDAAGSPYDDLLLEYTHPVHGGPVMTTMSASIQLLRPGVQTEAHRHTSSAVYHVVRGGGYSDVAGQRLGWTQGDTFAVPTWAEHRHANPGSEDALLFSFSDAPAVERLGLLRTSPAA